LIHWRSSAIVGVLSVCGSAGWALALALENAAKVRTLGQVELLFTFAVSYWLLRDRHTRLEFAASAVVLAGVLGVMIAG
jgi:drug/metabolite transporter (DMT)-like permease